MAQAGAEAAPAGPAWGQQAERPAKGHEYADGWFPLADRAGDIPEGIVDLRRRAEAAGRDPDSLTVSVFGAKPDVEVLRSYEKAGVTRAIFGLPVADRDIVLMVLDDLVKLVELFK